MGCGHQHAGSADAALRSTAFEKSFLKRMQLGINGEAFYGFDARAAGLKDGHEAAIHEFAIHADGARSTFAFAAAFLGSGKAEVFTEDVEEPLHWRNFDG